VGGTSEVVVVVVGPVVVVVVVVVVVPPPPPHGTPLSLQFVGNAEPFTRKPKLVEAPAATLPLYSRWVNVWWLPLLVISLFKISLREDSLKK
jgi:hypothetical protein